MKNTFRKQADLSRKTVDLALKIQTNFEELGV
jgi:hypothetical protein